MQLEGGGREEEQHHLIKGTHPLLFQRANARKRQANLRCKGRGKVAQPHEKYTLDIDVSLHGGISPGRPPDLGLMEDILSLDSPLWDFGEVKTLEEDFGMGDVKLAGSSMRRASHARSPALSLRRIDPY